jgi:cytochrome P450
MMSLRMQRLGVLPELPTTRSLPLDPPPELALLREREPLCRLRHRDGTLGWLVTTHALAREVLADPRFAIDYWRSPVGDPLERARVVDAGEQDFRKVMNAGALVAMNPPEHTRLRRLLTAFFTVRRMNEHRGSVERVVAACLEAMARSGPPVDMVEAFALPVPSMTLCELLGVPHGDRARFERPTAVIDDPAATADERIAAWNDFSEYARSVIERKRASPGRDVLSELVAAGELSDDELVGVAIQLFSGGHETTANMLSLSVFALLSERDRWQRVCADPSSIAGTVEELLRYLTITQVGALTRVALEAVELNGRTIAPGESVTVSLASANRDAARFHEPDAFDPARDAAGHVAFGFGRHMCLGQHLARLEVEVALRGLAARLPALRLALPAEDVVFHGGDHFLYGIHELPVAW